MVYENESEMSGGYQVLVSDNFHYMDEEEIYDRGTYATYEEALAVAQSAIEESVRNHNFDLKEYLIFGDDAYVLCPTGTNHPRFSGRDYARKLCEEHGQASNDGD